jgi:choline dehydrogenase-like flavoprotein
MPTSLDKQNNILADHITRTIPEVDCPEAYATGNDASEPGRRKAFQLIIRSQQAPNPESRLTLDSEKDALGLPLSRLNWALTDTDYTLVKRTAEIIAQECGRMGLGRLLTNLQENRQWPDLWAGGHHMGMTRMHSDPKQGVVDRNCKVHGLGNLYVAGPSTFTTGGYANPVLTIVTMALRMADHIKNSFTS